MMGVRAETLPRMRLSTLVPILFLPAFLLASCGKSVGYRGPMPGPAARGLLADLPGLTLPAGSVAACANELRLVSFLVTPTMPAMVADDATSPGPPPKGRHWIPLFTDGDVADLVLRATGEAPPGIGAAMSPEYRRFMQGRD